MKKIIAYLMILLTCPSVVLAQGAPVVLFGEHKPYLLPEEAMMPKILADILFDVAFHDREVYYSSMKDIFDGIPLDVGLVIDYDPDKKVVMYTYDYTLKGKDGAPMEGIINGSYKLDHSDITKIDLGMPPVTDPETIRQRLKEREDRRNQESMQQE